MAAFLTLIYLEYCKACLAEMQKHCLGAEAGSYGSRPSNFRRKLSFSRGLFQYL
jgi:hypothetical protein